MKKIIGVMPLWDDEKNSIWMLPEYLEGIVEAGGVPFIFPILEKREDITALCEKCDGFLFTGGQDVAPELYGQQSLEQVETCPKRDTLEAVVLSYALEHDKAVLGICRGIQFINVHLGGTLYQDIPSQFPTDTLHSMPAPYDRVCHTVKIVGSSPLYTLLQRDTIGVNSCHHQAVRQIAPGLSAMAVSEDGLVEALHMPDRKFLWAVQWHPEFTCRTDENSRKLFEIFSILLNFGCMNRFSGPCSRMLFYASHFIAAYVISASSSGVS